MPLEDDLLALAERAARAAGAELMERFGREPVAVRTKSTPTDPVSAADLAAEQAIREVLAAERPGDTVLGEEGGEARLTESGAGPGDSEGPRLRWVVDPLDGTVNFLYGIPQFAVSVACEDRRGALVGAVLDPVRDEMFSAMRGAPPLLDGRPIAAGHDAPLAETLVATGFSYDADLRAVQADVLRGLLPRVRDIRRGGAAALDLCWCACGRVDAYYERGLRAWDFAAGALLCIRAGLSVRRLPARTDGVRVPDGLLVAAPSIIAGLEQLVTSADGRGQ